MKKFTESANENANYYAGDKKVYNMLYNLIIETLTPKIDGEDSEKASLIGHDELVKELSKIVENKINMSRINVLEKLSRNPKIIQEKIEVKDDLLELIKEAKNNIDTDEKIQ